MTVSISTDLLPSENDILKQQAINEIDETCQSSWADKVEEEDGALILIKPKNKQKVKK